MDFNPDNSWEGYVANQYLSNPSADATSYAAYDFPFLVALMVPSCQSRKESTMIYIIPSLSFTLLRGKKNILNKIPEEVGYDKKARCHQFPTFI